MGFIDAVLDFLGFKKELDPDVKEANAYAQAIIAELTRMGKVYVKKTKDGNIFQQVRFKPPLKVLPDRVELEVDKRLPYGVGWSELKDPKIVEGLSTVCERVVTVKNERGSGFWYVVRRTKGSSKPNFKFSELRPPAGYNPRKTPLLIPIGRDDNGDQLWRDMEKIYHLLIGGATGMGKTSLLHSIICWLILHAPPTHVKLALIDLKEGLDFSRYNGVPHLVRPVAITPVEAHKTLKWINREISRRGELFREVRAENIETYRQRTGKFLNNIVFVFDEIANLGQLKLMGMPEAESEAWFWLKDGAQRARALGIHFIISTQRPSVKIIDGDIKMNFTARVGLGTATETDSRVILDNNLAHGLDVGDLIYQNRKMRGMELRGPYITADEADKIVDNVIRAHNLDSRQAAKAAELKTAKEKDLINRMLLYAVDELDGSFAVEKLFSRFGAEITLGRLKELARELEDRRILAPARGRKPRSVITTHADFVGYQLSVADKTENSAPDRQNGQPTDNTGGKNEG